MHTREIPKHPIVPQLSDSAIVELTKLCFRPDSIRKVDLIFQFGTSSHPDRAAAIISSLLTANVSKHVLITGGNPNFGDRARSEGIEAIRVSELIDREQFKDIQFILETKSVSTLGNIEEALKIFDFSTVNSILFVSKAHACGRAFLTLRKQVPNVTLFHATFASTPHGLSTPIAATNWFQSPEGRAIVWGEYLRIERYGERGDLASNEVEAQLQLITTLTA